MARKFKRVDPIIQEIEMALSPGRYIPYGASMDYVCNLETVKDKLDALIKKGEAKRAVGLYEIFLSGCYEKAEELDDSGGSLGCFFQALFSSWIRARQKAGYPAEETVRYIIKWMDKDDYGFCYNIEKDIALALDRKGIIVFRNHFEELFNKAFAPFVSKEPGDIYEYPRNVFQNADILKKIYIAKKDIKSYLVLCEKTTLSPADCEAIARILQDREHYEKALAIVEKGLALQSRRDWHNQDSCLLSGIKQELLEKLGRTEDALVLAWEEFVRYPSVFQYDIIMKYSAKGKRKQWHRKAMEVARKESLSDFIQICVKTKEWDMLAEHIITVSDEDIEDISHYVSLEAAKKLSKGQCLAAAKLYRALGMRVLNKGKSKYYKYALWHFRKARELYRKTGQEQLWQSLVKLVMQNHYRKFSFIGDFKDIVAGRVPERQPSFAEKMRKKWKKQID